jgi:hypothetical protein
MLDLRAFIQDNYVYFVVGSLGVGALWFVVGYQRVCSRLDKLEQAESRVRDGVRAYLKESSRPDAEEALQQFEAACPEAARFYKRRRPELLDRASVLAGLTGLSLFGFLVCILFAFIPPEGLPGLWQAAALASLWPALGLAKWGLMDRNEWSHLVTDTGNTATVWLALAFPMGLLSGRLDIAAGTVNPKGTAYEQRWTFHGLRWLRDRKVKVRMLAAVPDFTEFAKDEEKLGWAREQWGAVLARAEGAGLWWPALRPRMRAGRAG